MKRFDFGVFIKAAPVLCLMALALSGCGSDNDAGGGVGAPPVGSVIGSTQLPNGGQQFAFQGSTTRISASRALFGQFPLTMGNCGSTAGFSRYCACPSGMVCFVNTIWDYRTGIPQASFAYEERGQTFGVLTAGAGIPGGYSLQGLERYYNTTPFADGSSVTVAMNLSFGSAVVGGVINVGPEFSRRELAGLPIQSIALDLRLGGGGQPVGGTAYIYTSNPSVRSFMVF